jgi:hypothetical protein
LPGAIADSPRKNNQPTNVPPGAHHKPNKINETNFPFSSRPRHFDDWAAAGTGFSEESETEREKEQRAKGNFLRDRAGRPWLVLCERRMGSS